ncbi:hypothetical protein [Streptomyces sp. CS014]|uniref:hypothetical protein n=1 Tax=Streptomyces sp. CS014 TaxID=2162707 RepID=UPI000D50EA57|nr:hypothetical protein [Streptomyces sp. CS014]PVD04502.1 hypothetical protein DBP12_03490 [Streptomyces sp. CS014]
MTSSTLTAGTDPRPHYSPVFTLAHRANGASSSAYVAATAAASQHEHDCRECGPGKAVLMDDGWQPTFQPCPAGHQLRIEQARVWDEDHGGTYQHGMRPLSGADRQLLAGQVLDYLNARPAVYDQAAWMAHPPTLLAELALDLAADETPAAKGYTLCIAATVCHLAGWALRVGPNEANAIGPYRITRPIKTWAQELLDLTDEQAAALWQASNEEGLRLLTALAGR